MQPDPANMELARNFGLVLLLISAASLATGKTYSKTGNPFGLTNKRDNPRDYWVSVICYSILGLALVGMAYFAG